MLIDFRTRRCNCAYYY